MTMAVYKTLDKNPVPMLIAQAMMSNIGGTATMIGDPPNIIIGNMLKEHIGFMDFLLHLAPGVLMAAPFALGTLLFLYRKDLIGK